VIGLGIYIGCILAMVCLSPTIPKSVPALEVSPFPIVDFGIGVMPRKVKGGDDPLSEVMSRLRNVRELEAFHVSRNSVELNQHHVEEAGRGGIWERRWNKVTEENFFGGNSGFWLRSYNYRDGVTSLCSVRILFIGSKIVTCVTILRGFSSVAGVMVYQCRQKMIPKASTGSCS